MNEAPREMVWKVEPKAKKSNPTTSGLKKEMNDLKKEFNKLSQFLIQNLVDMEAELALLKQENERLKNKVDSSVNTSSAEQFTFLPSTQLPALSAALLM